MDRDNVVSFPGRSPGNTLCTWEDGVRAGFARTGVNDAATQWVISEMRRRRICDFKPVSVVVEQQGQEAAVREAVDACFQEYNRAHVANYASLLLELYWVLQEAESASLS